MDGIVKLAVAVLARLTALERARAVAPNIIVAVVFGVLALLAGSAALGCGIAALWIGLLPLVESWAVPLICAGVLLLAAIVLIAGGYAILRGGGRSKIASGSVAEAIDSGDVTPLIASVVQEHKWILLAATVLAGAVAGGKLAKDPPRKS